MKADVSFLERLLASGLLVRTGVDGLYGRSGGFESVVDGLESLVSRQGADDGAEVLRFPPAMPRADLERNGYFAKFPHLAGTVSCFCGDERAHRDLVRQMAAGGDWTTAQAVTDVALTPAACYPVYPMMAARGPLAAEGVVLDVMSWCFRREPSLEPTRMQAFRQREHVRIGTPAQVDAFRELWLSRARRMGEALRLPFEIEVANDPFFGRAGRLQADNQKAQAQKFEFLVPVNEGAGPTACMSFNNHSDNFSAAWGIEAADGGMVHTGCVGFGLERLTLALLRHHGLALAEWPGPVRAVLWP